MPSCKEFFWYKLKICTYKMHVRWITCNLSAEERHLCILYNLGVKDTEKLIRRRLWYQDKARLSCPLTQVICMLTITQPQLSWDNNFFRIQGFLHENFHHFFFFFWPFTFSPRAQSVSFVLNPVLQSADIFVFFLKFSNMQHYFVLVTKVVVHSLSDFLKSCKK